MNREDSQARAGGGGERKLYELDPAERRARLRELVPALTEADIDVLASEAPLSIDRADRLIENVVSVFPLPLGIATNFRVDGEEVAVPMAIEEASVVAGASHGAKLLRTGPLAGIATEADPPRMVGQVQVLDIDPPIGDAAAALGVAEADILAVANRGHERLAAAGGGARAFGVRVLETRLGPCLVCELEVDVRDAMGANAVSSMCEEIAPLVAAKAGGRAGLRILTNLCDRRLARANGRVKAAALGGSGGVQRIVEASAFAEADPYRAATHNKGIMNGIDALLVATGQDWRAAEAGAHAFAARGGRYGPLSTWTEADDGSGDLVGRIELPVAVGTVGGGTEVHPTARVARRIVRCDGGPGSARRLARLAAAVGLAQNLAAIRALAAEGIQRGHMELHRRARG